jgi:hypothetical protein
MVTKSKLVKLFISLGVKGILCIICLASVGAALVTYTTNIAITPTVQLTQGETTATWTLYVNEFNLNKYIPSGDGGVTEMVLNPADPHSYSFKVVTDADKVCAVKVELVAPVDTEKFSKFDITVLSSTGTSWDPEPLYTTSTGSTTKAAVNGLLADQVGYVHQDVTTTKYYEVKVNYNYDLKADDTPITVTLRVTPLPQDGF